ncbi:MAG: hypothetical protein EOO53_20140 [Gammaproteobacteria bacterium]|nr:MAG: hypothetical protein EOO53_20140 [Gammaproteobacteria bacterium]
MKRSFICLFFLLWAQFSFGQTDLSDVQERLTAYTKTQLPEKIFLHTDKTFYVAGETVWFKIYVVDGVFHTLSPTDKVAYVELLDRTNAPVLRAKIALGEGGGNGSFQLPFTLSTGYYTIKCYTNWMKNLGADHFFEKSLTIVNTLKSPEQPAEKTKAAYMLQLFPEGGNLINSLSSKVAFHLTDQFGKGVKGEGYLLNKKNDTLSSFLPFKFGMGHFNLTPQNGEAYKVVFKLNDGQTVSTLVPRSLENGYTMHVDETAENRLKITVQTTLHSGSPIYLLAQTRQVVNAVQMSAVNDGTTVFLLDKNRLGAGISQLTIFDQNKNPVCERLFFVQPKSTDETRLRLSKERYGTREKVDLSLLSSAKGNQNMSLSIYQLDGLNSEHEARIDEYLWLTSELHGLVEEPAYYLSAPSAELKQASDYLMLTHGWRRFKWEKVLRQPTPPAFQREQFSQIITGVVTDTRTNETVKNVQVFLSIPNTVQQLYTSISDSTGHLHFHVKDYYGEGEIIAQVASQNDSFYKITINSPFAEPANTLSNPLLALDPSQQTSLENRSLSVQTQYVFSTDSIIRFFRPAISDTFPFYGQPLYQYNLDEYVRFNSMEEVLREYVREISVGVKGSGGSLRLKLFNETNRELYSDDILVMVDGIPLKNANKVFSIDPLQIKQLDVINRNYVLGNKFFHGLAGFKSYSGAYKGLELDPNSVIINYDGLQLQREFYSPNYSSETLRNSRLPDLRNTLLWMPDVQQKEISFYTGDNKGKYLIVLQGFDQDGQIVNASLQLEVQ